MRSGRKGAAVVAFAAAVGALASGCSGGGSGQDGSSADRVTVVGADAEGSPVPTASNPQSSPAPATPGSAGSRVPVCAEIATWGTSLKESAPYTGAELYGVRSGRHDCYDRVVFDVNGADTVGYHIRYVESVHADGSGEPIPAAGDAALEVIVHAPDFASASSGHQPWRDPWKVGETLLDPHGWKALEAVKFAGSFEGQTTFAVGVDARVPFRVHTLTDDAVTHVVLDIAHGEG
ncbi:MAG: AMIN-like domain-containing (lipo)protein [Jiangellaceae bacterium]